MTTEQKNNGEMDMRQGNLHDDHEAFRKLSDRLLQRGRWVRFRYWVDIPALALFVLAMTALFAPPYQDHLTLPEAKPGQSHPIISHTLRATRDLLVEDTAATEERRAQARAGIPSVYDYDPDFFLALGDQARRAIALMREAKVQANKQASSDLAARHAAFAENLGVEVSLGIFQLIEKMKEPEDVAIAIQYFLNLGLDRMVVAERRQLPDAGAIEVRNRVTGGVSSLSDASRIMDLRSLQRRMGARAADAPFGEARIIRSWILETARAMAGANLQPNELVTEERRQAAEAGVSPVFVHIQAGEVLLRRGDRVTDQVRQRVELLNKHSSDRLIWAETIAVAVLLTGIVLLGFTFFRWGRAPLGFERKRSYLSLGAFSATAALSVAFYYAGLGLAEGLGFDPRLAAYFAPLSLATVLVALLLDARTSLLVGIALSLFVTYRVDGDLWLVTYYVVGVLAAGIAARTSRRRFDLLRVGVGLFVVKGALAPIIIILAGLDFTAYLAPLLGAAFFSSFIVAFAALGVLPVLEQIFDETTDLRLLELASGDNPILRELAVASPGTYHHSVMVANLAEAAAENIGASGLRCRVMALYHDIGKIKRPAYFAENQREGENLHDRLPPETSARVLLAHVHDGLEMASRQGLGRVILEGIAQHHGNSLMRSIYERARTAPGGNQVSEADYRYPGQKPASREAGVLMLADSTEAATRALQNPTPEELRKRIRQIMETVIADGQLDDCQLTLKDLAAIEKSFAHILALGVYHNRIEYPPAPRAKHRGEFGDIHESSDRSVRILRPMADGNS